VREGSCAGAGEVCQAEAGEEAWQESGGGEVLCLCEAF
jgi:hypothetical protein